MTSENFYLLPEISLQLLTTDERSRVAFLGQETPHMHTWVCVFRSLISTQQIHLKTFVHCYLERVQLLTFINRRKLTSLLYHPQVRWSSSILASIAIQSDQNLFCCFLFFFNLSASKKEDKLRCCRRRSERTYYRIDVEVSERRSVMRCNLALLHRLG